MKGEPYIYPVLFVLIIALMHLEWSLYTSSGEKAQVFEISGEEEIWINVNCTVFISKGDNRKMVIQGPEGKVSALDIQDSGKRITIESNTGDALLSYIGIYKRTDHQIKICISSPNPGNIYIRGKANVISSDYFSAS